MKKIIFLFFLIFFSLDLFCEENPAVEEEISVLQENEDTEKISPMVKKFVNRSFFSFDLSYMALGFKGGFGLGISDEIKLWRYNSLKLGFANYYLFPEDEKINMVIGIRPTMDLLTYPFGKGMDKLYVGFGCGTDFLCIEGDNVQEEYRRSSVISLNAITGWKQFFSDYLLVDFFCGYRFIINPDDVYEPYVDYVKHGMEYGVKFKINLNKFFK